MTSKLWPAAATAFGLMAALGLTACNDSGVDSPAGNVRIEITESRPGTQQHVVLTSAVDGADISFELFEPDQLEAGKSYPLVLEGHGYGGSRQTARSGFIARLTAAGYYVISIDQRGFGDAGGTVRVMSPDFEGQDLIQILDWAEDLPGLAREGDGNMRLGAYGSSYGGGYQFLLNGADPKNRLDALAPDITWHDLRYSLNPNNVIKSGWVLFLTAGGEAGSQLQQDLFIREGLLQGTITNNFPEPLSNLFAYHSPIYHCDRQEFLAQDFLLATSDPGNVASREPPKVDVLITQGVRDVLFNLNEAVANYDCYRRLGGDVRLLTHESGHILPVALPEALRAPLDPLYALINVPEFQNPGGPRNCGDINLGDAQFAWFEEKLRDQRGAIDAVISTGSEVCFSLGTGDAIALPDVPRGGMDVAVDGTIPQLNSVLGIAGSLLGNGLRDVLLADIPLGTAGPDGAVLAGLPQMALSVEGVSGLEMAGCALPILSLACDPIYLLALSVQSADGVRRGIIDDQLTPIRGFGAHGTLDAPMDMTGIAERLQPGDQLFLQVYGFHLQFPVTWSRDLLVPASTINGTVSLPVVAGSLDG